MLCKKKSESPLDCVFCPYLTDAQIKKKVIILKCFIVLLRKKNHARLYQIISKQYYLSYAYPPILYACVYFLRIIYN